MDSYQQQAARTARSDFTDSQSMCNFVLGLVGETGEVADLIKKWLFHDHEPDLNVLKNEIGDILWYIANLARMYGLSLGDIAESNLQKLWRRYPNGFNREDSIRRRDYAITTDKGAGDS